MTADEFTPWCPWGYIAWMLNPDGEVEAVLVPAHAATVEDCRYTMRIVGVLSAGAHPGIRVIVNDPDDPNAT